MKIAGLGWGSLLWTTGPLQLASAWNPDGPTLPIEFARVGDGGELSTALCNGSWPQTVWWAELATTSLDEARELLRQREDIDPARPEWIGSLPGMAQGFEAEEIGRWLDAMPLDAVVWTALPPRVDGVEGRCPNAQRAVDYLRGLTGEKLAHAEHYIRSVPASLDTVNRRQISLSLGWWPKS